MKIQKHHNQDGSDERGLVPLRDMMNRLFSESFLFPSFTDSFFSDPFSGITSKNVLGDIKVDIEEMEKEFTVTAELPGVDPDKIDLNVDENLLTISAEIGSEKENKGKNYLHRECSYGKIQRSFDFSHSPVNIEKAEANFKNGVLKISLPKKEKDKSKGKKIPINA